MDIVVGRIPAIATPGDKRLDTPQGIEARVLHVRQPRRSRNPAKVNERQRRASSPQADPPGARVLIVLVPEAHRLPDDLESGNYRTFLRFVRR